MPRRTPPIARYFGSEAASEFSAGPDRRSSAAVEDVGSRREEDVGEDVGSGVAVAVDDVASEALEETGAFSDTEDAALGIEDGEVTVKLVDDIADSGFAAVGPAMGVDGSGMEETCLRSSAGPKWPSIVRDRIGDMSDRSIGGKGYLLAEKYP